MLCRHFVDGGEQMPEEGGAEATEDRKAGNLGRNKTAAFANTSSAHRLHTLFDLSAYGSSDASYHTLCHHGVGSHTCRSAKPGGWQPVRGTPLADQRPRTGAATVQSPLRLDEASMVMQSTSVWQRRSSRQLISSILKQVMNAGTAMTSTWNCSYPRA